MDIFAAIKVNDRARVLALIQANSNVCNVIKTTSYCDIIHRSTPLCEVIRNGHAGVVELLLQNGASVNAMFEMEDVLDSSHRIFRSSPLELAVNDQRKTDVEIVSLLLRWNAAVTVRDENGSFHLRNVVRTDGIGGMRCCSARIIRVLLEHGARVDAQDKYENAFLCHAFGCRDCTAEIVEFLLEHGARVDTQDKFGNTPLHEACHVDVARCLLVHGARVDVRNKHESTPLHHVALSGHADVARFLLKHGALVDAQDSDGNTPLHNAVAYGINDRHGAAVVPFLEYGACVDIQNRFGFTQVDSAKSRFMLNLRSCFHDDISDDEKSFFLSIKLVENELYSNNRKLNESCFLDKLSCLDESSRESLERKYKIFRLLVKDWPYYIKVVPLIPVSEKALAFSMSVHGRLGKSSPARSLPPDTRRMICEMASQPHSLEKIHQIAQREREEEELRRRIRQQRSERCSLQ